MTRVGVSQLLSARLFLSCETPSRDSSTTSRVGSGTALKHSAFFIVWVPFPQFDDLALFIYTKVGAVRYSARPEQVQDLALFYHNLSGAPRQGLFALFSTFTTFDHYLYFISIFIAPSKTQNLYLPPLSSPHTHDLYQCLYNKCRICFNRFLLTFDLGPVSMWRIEWSGLNLQGFRSFGSKNFSSGSRRGHQVCRWPFTKTSLHQVCPNLFYHYHVRVTKFVVFFYPELWEELFLLGSIKYLLRYNEK